MSNAPVPPRSSWVPPRALLNVFLVGILLRLMALGWWSLWLDEGATWSWAAAPDWEGTLYAEANHPPVWWLITRAWITFFGDSEAALRAPAAILGVLSMGLVWILGLRVLDPSWAPRRGGFPSAADGGRGRRMAAWFTGLFALSAYFLEYAQEARMYTALLVEVLGLCLLYLRWLDKKDKLSLVLYAILGALALYTHYFAVWPLIAHGAHALWLGWRSKEQPERLNPWPFVVAVAVAGLLFEPWFLYVLRNFQKFAHIAPEPFSYVLYAFWRMGAGPGLAVPDRLTQLGGPEYVWQENSAVIVGVAVLWFVPMLIGIVALVRRPGLRSFLTANVVLPIAFMLAIYTWFPLIHECYLIFLAPWIVLLVTLGAFSAPRLLRPLLIAGVVVLTMAGVVAYHGASQELVPVNRQGEVIDPESTEALFPWRYMPDPEAPLYPLQGDHPYGREPWRQAHAFVRRHAGPDDVVLLHPWYVHLVWDYYAGRALDRRGRPQEPLETFRLPERLLTHDQLVARYAEELRGRERVFLILAHEETEDPDDYAHALQKALAAIWLEAGGWPDVKGPILFHLSWGVRVAVYTRK